MRRLEGRFDQEQEPFDYAEPSRLSCRLRADLVHLLMRFLRDGFSEDWMCLLVEKRSLYYNPSTWSPSFLAFHVLRLSLPLRIYSEASL